MRFFRRSSAQPDPTPQPSPFVAEVLRRIGEDYGGFDALAPLSATAGGPGMEVAIHIAGTPDPDREPFLHGTGIIRTARVYPDRTEVYDGETLLARFEDLTTADLVD